MKDVHKYIIDPSEEIIRAYLRNLHRKDYREHFEKSGEPSAKAVASSSKYVLPHESRKAYKIEDTALTDVYMIDSGKPGKTIFYIHGGGYWDQPTSFHYSFLRKLVGKTGGKAYIPVYPKAPSYHLDDAHEFLIKAYEACCKDENEQNLIIMGDSAGGGCSLALAEKLSNKGYKIPRLILLSPWLDLSCEKKDEEKDSDPWLDRSNLRKMGVIYAGEKGISSPEASPLFSSLNGIDDITILTGTSDILSYDAILLEEKFPKIDLHVFEKSFHDFALFPIGFAADKAFSIIAAKVSEERK